MMMAALIDKGRCFVACQQLTITHIMVAVLH
jgi:hypothetical protein